MTLFAETRGGTRIAYVTAGRPWRPALVLNHSLGSDRHMWDLQVEAVKSDYFVVSLDNIGHGESDVPAGDYSIADLGEAVLSVADAAEVDEFHYCGLSVGGLTGQWLAIHHPARLLSVTLCNTAACIGTADVWNERIRTVLSDGIGALVDAVLARWFSDDFASRQPALFTQARATLLATNPVGYAGVCAALRDGDLRANVGSITTRALVIAGSLDQGTTVEQGRWLHEQIAGSRFVALEAAHLSNLDRDSDFTAALSTFLAETTPSLR